MYPHVRGLPGDIHYNEYFFSHVMTFFDRKVDLAQFAPDDPLYMMCRTWMRNDPSNSEETAVPAPSPPQCATDNREIYRYSHDILQCV